MGGGARLAGMGNIFSGFSGLAIRAKALGGNRRMVATTFCCPAIVRQIVYRGYNAMGDRRIVPTHIVTRPIVTDVRMPTGAISNCDLVRVGTSNARAPIDISCGARLGGTCFHLSIAAKTRLLQVIPAA